MGPFTDAELGYLMALFGDLRRDIDSVPFAHEDSWDQVGDTSEESAP